MNNVTRILSAIEQGDPKAAEGLLPLVYDELRNSPSKRLSHEKPGQTLQPTDLVHEAYLRLVHLDPSRPWDGRAHFFAAAAEAMRRILVDAARQKATLKRGGHLDRVQRDPTFFAVAPETPPDELLAVNEAVELLAQTDPRAAELVKLHFFAGLSLPESASLLGLSTRTAERLWTYARAWLRRAIESPHASKATTTDS